MLRDAGDRGSVAVVSAPIGSGVGMGRGGGSGGRGLPNPRRQVRTRVGGRCGQVMYPDETMLLEKLLCYCC